MTAPEIERQERLLATAADDTTHHFYTHDEVQATIAAVMMGAVKYCDRLSERAYESGDEVKGRYLSCISAGIGDMISTDAIAALEGVKRQAKLELMKEVLAAIYNGKVNKDGLVDVRYDFGHGSTADRRVEEVFKMQLAILAGKTTPMDFGDLLDMKEPKT
jgi:hypothetical protein